MLKNERLTIVQYAGDFREASRRLHSGGVETYRAQRHSVEFIESLARRLGAVATITASTDDVYDEVLESGARAIGAGPHGRIDYRTMLALIDRTDPTLLIVRSPMRPVLAYARRRRLRTLALLADSYNPKTLRGRAALWLAARHLRNSVIDAVANHGRNSSLQLVRAGVPAGKVIPWDWPAVPAPAWTAKSGPSSNTIVYVGTLSRAKGVVDLIRAFEIVSRERQELELHLYGNPTAEIRQEVDASPLRARIALRGRIANDDVVPAMRAADVIVVPSRHEYPEGLPITIYEALASRTPLIVSDHPMFAGNVTDETSALVFAAGRTDDLAAAISRLLTDHTLYARLSERALDALEALRLPVEWSELIEHWIAGDSSWLRSHSVAAGDRSASR